MMYGHLEEPDDVIEHLERTRDLQDLALSEGNEAFTAFIPWSYKRGDTPLAKRLKQESAPTP